MSPSLVDVSHPVRTTADASNPITIAARLIAPRILGSVPPAKPPRSQSDALTASALNDKAPSQRIQSLRTTTQLHPPTATCEQRLAGPAPIRTLKVKGYRTMVKKYSPSGCRNVN